MTTPVGRLIAAALGHAGEVLAAEADLGQLLHRTPDGGRSYLRVDSWGSTLTVVGAGRQTVAYEVVGVDLRDLT